MEKETPQELLERMAPFFGLKKAPQKGGGYRWAERQRVKVRPTQRAADEAVCSAKYHLLLAEKGDTVCGVCHSPLRR